MIRLSEIQQCKNQINLAMVNCRFILDLTF
jgi:hypothetical protein